MKFCRKELIRLARTGAEDGYDDAFHKYLTTNQFYLAEMKRVADEARAALANLKPKNNDRSTVQ